MGLIEKESFYARKTYAITASINHEPMRTVRMFPYSNIAFDLLLRSNAPNWVRPRGPTIFHLPASSVIKSEKVSHETVFEKMTMRLAKYQQKIALKREFVWFNSRGALLNLW